MPSIQDFATIVSALGEPYVHGSDYAVYNEDCLRGLRRVPAACVDLTVTSPPYNIGKEYERPLPLDEYIAWTTTWLAEVHRVTKPHGALCLNLGYVSVPGRGHAVPLPYLLWDRIPFFIVQEIVWNYEAGVAARRRLSPRNEKILWCVKDENSYTFNLDDIRDPDVKYPHQKKNGKLRCNTIGKNPSDVWRIAKVTSGTHRASAERTPHPAQFPVDLVERMVKGFSNPGDIVLDPFMGSGSTAEACMRSGRCAIGFELDGDYCRHAGVRLAGVEDDRRRLIDVPAMRESEVSGRGAVQRSLADSFEALGQRT
jgi:adenine-specific DNA-methyltransferase